MFNIIIKVVFKLIQILGNILIQPIFFIASPLLNLIGFRTFAGSILEFVEYSLTYVDFIIDIFHIPRAALSICLGLGATILVFNVTLWSFTLIKNVYSIVKTGSVDSTAFFKKGEYNGKE